MQFHANSYKTKAEIKREEEEASIEKLRELLLYLSPGQDAQIKFRTSDRRGLSGYWLWDMVNLHHNHTPRRDVRARHKGDELRTYHARIFRHTWRWKDAMKKLKQCEDQHAKETTNDISWDQL